MSYKETMTNEREIYLAATKLDRGEDLDQFVSRACRGDANLKHRVECLLHARQDRQFNLLKQVTGDTNQTMLTASDRKAGGAADHESTDFEPAPLPELPRYRLVEEIGRGGMGTVYLAKQIEPVEREVAVKVINPGMDSREVLSRFEAERQTLALMDHPNIARVFDGGTTDSGLPFFAMELVRGLPITDYCYKHGLDLRTRIKLFVDVCHAVQHAHHKGIIHRDLKPGNILVFSDGDKPTVKVIDFGVAKALHRADSGQTVLTQYPSFIGTPLYVSPEQARPSEIDVDTRSDIYSLGVVLYELLTGSTPFRRETLSQVGLDAFRELVADKSPERPSKRLTGSRSSAGDGGPSHTTHIGYQPGDLREELDWVVLKSLDKDRERRYESAKALGDDLEHYLCGEEVLACPPKASYRLRKWCGKNRVCVAVGGLAISTLIFITLTSLWQVREVREAWRQSQVREQQATELLTANQLQSAIRAFRQSDIKSIPRRLRTGDASLGLREEANQRSYFRQLLLDLANPSYDLEASVHHEIEDLVWDHKAGHAWVLDAQGDFYRFHRRDDSLSSDTPPPQKVGSVGGPADSMAVSPNGQRLAIGMKDGTVSLWKLYPEPGELWSVLAGDGGVETVVWSDDGETLAAGTRYDGVWVGDADGQELFRIDNDHRHESLVFSPDGKQLIVPNRKGFAYFSIPDGAKLDAITQAGKANPRQLILAGPRKNWLLTCDRFSQVALVYDAKTGKEIGEVELASTYPQSLAVWPDGRWITAVYPSGLLQIIALSQSRSGQISGKSIAQFNIGESGDVFKENATLRVSVLPRHNGLITAGPGGRVRHWRVGRVLPTQLLQPPSRVNAAYPLTSDELVLFFARQDTSQSSIGDRAVPKGIGKKSHRVIGSPIGMPVTCFSKQTSDQGWIACAGPGHVSIYDLQRGELVRCLTPALDIARVVEISPDGHAVAVNGGVEGGLMTWASKDGWRSADCVLDKQIHVDGVMCFHRRANKNYLLYDESSNRIVESATNGVGSRVLIKEKSHRFLSSALSPSKGLLAIGSRDALRVVDLTECGRGFTVDQLSSVRCVVFLPGEQVLLTGHANGNVEAWYLPTQQSLGTFIEPKLGVGAPCGLSFFPDSHRVLVSYSRDGSVAPLVVGTDRGRSSIVNE